MPRSRCCPTGNHTCAFTQTSSLLVARIAVKSSNTCPAWKVTSSLTQLNGFTAAKFARRSSHVCPTWCSTSWVLIWTNDASAEKSAIKLSAMFTTWKRTCGPTQVNDLSAAKIATRSSQVRLTWRLTCSAFTVCFKLSAVNYVAKFTRFHSFSTAKSSWTFAHRWTRRRTSQFCRHKLWGWCHYTFGFSFLIFRCPHLLIILPPTSLLVLVVFHSQMVLWLIYPYQLPSRKVSRFRRDCMHC